MVALQWYFNLRGYIQFRRLKVLSEIGSGERSWTRGEEVKRFAIKRGISISINLSLNNVVTKSILKQSRNKLITWLKMKTEPICLTYYTTVGCRSSQCNKNYSRFTK